MSTFGEAVRQRVRAARSRLEDARATGDAYEAALAEDELDDALRLARKHGIGTDDADAPAEEVGEA
ncbi:hypothetical protein ACGFMM_22730 [Streptomyces sp. NPDC048604]|uniref:hypothetical protein n=1 Tax=Streptomyces sp. NPDC048604 TaxID=3365578 RepID=UPI003711A274